MRRFIEVLFLCGGIISIVGLAFAQTEETPPVQVTPPVEYAIPFPTVPLELTSVRPVVLMKCSCLADELPGDAFLLRPLSNSVAFRCARTAAERDRALECKDAVSVL